MEIEARPHGAALARPLARALAVGALGGAGMLAGGEIHWALEVAGAVLVALGALLAALAVLEWERTSVHLTGDRVLVEWGILRRRAAEVRLDRREPVEFHQSVLGRILGYGSLIAGGMEVPYVPRDAALS